MCNAVAKAKPPKNKKIVGSENVAKACLVVTRLSAIANNGTSNAVIVTCRASLNQSTAIKPSRAKPAFSLGAKGKNFNKKKNSTISAMNIMLFLWFLREDNSFISSSTLATQMNEIYVKGMLLTCNGQNSKV